MKQLHVWIVQTGESLPTDGPSERPMRATNLANALLLQGHQVTIISSDFWHQKKTHRTGRVTELHFAKHGRLLLIPSPGYRRHVGLARFYDHWRLGKSFAKIARLQSRPDIMVVGFPPVEISAEAIRLAHEWSIPSLLDVKDQWPDIFWNKLPPLLRPMARLGLFPLSKSAKYAFQSATGITSMSKPFLDWALLNASRSLITSDGVFPFGVTDPYTNLLGKTKPVANQIAFVGSITSSFDFETLILGFSRSAFCNITHGRLLICGSGDAETRVREFARNFKGVEFCGWLDSNGIAQVLSNSILAAAPYIDRQDFAASLPNKLIEYSSYGVPVIAPRVGEIASFIQRVGVGGIYKSGDVISCAQSIDSTINQYNSLGEQARIQILSVFRQGYEVNMVYKRFVSHIENVSQMSKQIVRHE